MNQVTKTDENAYNDYLMENSPEKKGNSLADTVSDERHHNGADLHSFANVISHARKMGLK